MVEVFFDVETQKLFSDIGSKDPVLLKLSIVSIYKREIQSATGEENGQALSFWENEIEKAWTIFEEADRIIGFNSISFDVLVLKPYFPQKFAKLNHFDMLEKIREAAGRRISLNAFAFATLGKTKKDDGFSAVKYWNRGDKESLEKLRCYCEDDVAITRDLYDFGFKNGYLKYIDPWNNQRRVEVDFSYPKTSAPLTKQVGLF